ncbi:MAG: DUF481 domain-containing protein [Acidobacteriota bacterium]
MTGGRRRTALAVAVSWLATMPALAQAPPDGAAASVPPPSAGWEGSFSAGLALTQGNRDTSTMTLGYDITRETGGALSFKSAGTLLRGRSQGELTANRLGLDVRGERRLSARTSLSAQVQFLRDEFKQIDYLVSPTLGVSQRLVTRDRTELAVDVGVGVAFEQNPGRPVDRDGAVTAGQQFRQRLSETAECTQKVSALWKMDDVADGLYVVGVGLSASVTSRTQIKAELLNTFKNKPPSAAVQRNDVAILLSFVYKY